MAGGNLPRRGQVCRRVGLVVGVGAALRLVALLLALWRVGRLLRLVLLLLLLLREAVALLLRRLAEDRLAWRRLLLEGWLLAVVLRCAPVALLPMLARLLLLVLLLLRVAIAVLLVALLLLEVALRLRLVVALSLGMVALWLRIVGGIGAIWGGRRARLL